MVVLSNTIDAGALVEQRRASSIDIPDEVLRHISPPGTRHLIFNGDYLWDKAGRKVAGSRDKQIA